MNYLIKSDNIDALDVLKERYSEAVDVVYIDPPYNTGKKMGKYKDSFGSHEEWTDFMRPRLEKSLPLLKKSCAIFISIGEHELAHLKILCNEVFGEKNYVSLITWQNKHTTQNDKAGIANQTEYILVYCKDKKSIDCNKDPQREEYLKKTYKNPDNDPRGDWRGGVMLYKDKNPHSYTVTSPSGVEWTKPWNYSQKSWNEELEEEDLIWWGENNDKCPVKKVFRKDVEKTGRTPVNLWTGINKDDRIREVGFTSDGKKDLSDITGSTKDFMYPKPVKLIKRILAIASHKDSVVLDYFAGSGTTGQAVLEANCEDGGSREFVLVTNNEENICDEVTYPRIKKVIEGYEDTKGTGGELTYIEDLSQL
jgi:adenine-specific DNA-methyltransferase